MAKCKFCGNEITWLRDGRKNTPIDLEGLPHSCEEMKTSRDSLKSLDPGTLSPEEIAKYETGINNAPTRKKRKFD